MMQEKSETVNGNTSLDWIDFSYPGKT